MSTPNASTKPVNRIPISAKRDFLESLTSAKPLTAVAQLVWNGLDAESDRVEIHFDLNAMEGLQAVRIRDYGTGIPHGKVKTLFGSLGDSWKRDKGRTSGRAMHGKNGKGRFKAFALGASVEWNSTFYDDGSVYSYRIWGNVDALDDFRFTDPVEAEGMATGTEVVITNLSHNFRSLTEETALLEMARLFAAYMSQYPQVSIEYDGILIDPKVVQDNRADYDLGEVVLDNGKRVPVVVSIIEWTVSTKRAIHLCDSDGVSLHEVEAGQQIPAPGFHFTGYVKCDHFRELDKGGNLNLEELHLEVDEILRPAKAKIKEHFRRRQAERQSHVVERWKEEQIYPYEDKDVIGPVEEAERQVFDILAVNVQSYLSSFEEADTQSRRFTFRLLAQAIRENPESVQEIIGEVLGLKKEEQDDLAELLRKTSLSSIISTAKIVANRLDFLLGLENLLFDKDTKKKLLERDQLHKILEKEAWIFQEEFVLAGSEQRLEEVLQKHIEILGEREDSDADDGAVEMADGKRGRVDLMLSKALQPRTGEYDYLIVELKRPSKKIDDSVVTQIKKYARAVASDERFHGVRARWTFIAVSNELDDFASREAKQRNRPRGQISDDDEFNITVWVKEWGEVINDARSRLRFINSQLSYEADRESAKSHLKKTHEKFIPEQDPDDIEAETE